MSSSDLQLILVVGYFCRLNVYAIRYISLAIGTRYNNIVNNVDAWSNYE